MLFPDGRRMLAMHMTLPLMSRMTLSCAVEGYAGCSRDVTWAEPIALLQLEA